MIHEFDPEMRPDSDFESGELRHLVPGNRGRMLDPRRTPMCIVSLQPETGMFVCEVQGFEDQGARWELPFEKVRSFQFERPAENAGDAQVRAFEAAVLRFDRPLEIPADPAQRARTLERLSLLRRQAGEWLDGHSRFLSAGGVLDFSSRDGDARLWMDLRAWLSRPGLGEIEDGFASQYVSNPHAGERVKGHRIVLADLGLASYRDTIVRNPSTFEGAWNKAARADHILHRMAFVHALFERCCAGPPLLYRGIATESPPESRQGAGLVAATFSRAVADSILGPPGTPRHGVIREQRVPISRLFMTYLETEHMNRPFREAEAVLLAEPAGELF